MAQRIVFAPVIAALLLLGVPTVFAQFQESPLLAARVAAGDLPPIEDRIPADPFVRQVEEEIGEYSGTMRVVSQHQWGYGTFFTQGEMPGLFQVPMSLEEHVAMGGPIAGFEPKYAEYYTWLDDGSTMEVKIREGARWSDGHPLTAVDIIWPFENMYTNPGYSARMTNLQSSYKGERFEVTKVDDLTVRFHSPAGPWAGQLRETFEGYPQPAHYLEQHHPDFADGKTWEDFRAARSRVNNLAIPSLQAWLPVETDESTGTLWERNAYYPVVDAEGKQLPYFDYVRVSRVTDGEARYLSVIQGEVDICAADCGDLNKHAVLKDNESRGNYDTLIWKGSRQTSQISWRYPTGQQLKGAAPGTQDPNFQAAGMTNQFRQALSIGIDREEINEKLFAGLAVPSVTGIPRDHALYDPIQDTFLGPDREEAWRLFAEIGITDSDGDGMLEYADGSDVHIFVPGATNGLLNVETVEALIDEWTKLGVSTTLVAADWSTIASKMRAGEIALQVSTGVPDYSPFHYLGIWHNRVSYAWGDPIEQPESYDKAFELELAYASATTVEEQQAAAKAFFNHIATESLSWPAFVTERPQQVIRHKCMGNVPDVRVFQKFMMTAKTDQWFVHSDCSYPRPGG
jgi:peptide/nickel transport system substrate-binding protein